MFRCMIAFFFIVQSASAVLGQRQYKMYGGADCTLDYLIFSPSGKKSEANPKIILLCDHDENLYDCFESDSLRRLPEFKQYDFYYIPNNHKAVLERLDCLDVVHYKATFSTSASLKANEAFLFIGDPAISSDFLASTTLRDLYTNITLISDLAKSDDQQNENIKIDYKKVIDAFKSPDEHEGLFPQFNGSAQNFNYTLSGRLMGSETRESLPFADIVIKGTSISTTTNMDGYFTLHNVPSDTSTLVASYLGYITTEVNLNPNLSKINLLIEISPSSLNLSEVVITGQREDILQVSTESISTIKMTPKKLKQLPNLGEQDIMRSFQLMPGVSASNESSSGMYIRGGTPDQNLIVFDGFTVYQVDHLYGFYSAFNSNAIKDVQLYKGGFESRFGGRLSSVTEITGKDGNQKNFNVGGSVSLLNINAYAEVPMSDRFTSIVSFRRSYKGFIYNTIFDKFTTDNVTSFSQFQNRFATTVSSYFYDLNGKFSLMPTDKDILSLSVFNGNDNLDNGYSINTPQRLLDLGIDFSLNISDLTNYGNFGTGLKWSRRWSSKLYGNTVICLSNYYSNREFVRSGTITNQNESQNISGGFSEDNNLIDYSFKSDYELDLLQSVQIKFGAFGTAYNIKYDYTQNDSTSVIAKDDNGKIGGGYLQTHCKVWQDRLKILPGIRWTYYDVTDKFYFEPRLSVNYKLSGKLKLSFGWGKYYQFANQVTREDLSSGSKDFWVLSNGNEIPVSSSEHCILGLYYETSKYLFSVEGYYKNLYSVSEYNQYIQSSIDGITYNENFYNGNGYSKGLEFLIQKKTGKLNGWLSYTLAEAKNNFDIYGSDYFLANQDVTHEFKAVGIYSYKRWDFSATWVYATGRPYTAPAGAYSLTLLDGEDQDYFTTTDKNSVRLAAYHRLDMAINYKLYRNTYGQGNKDEIGHIGFSIFNGYNRTNTWYNQYEIIEGEIIETNINHLGFMPNITVSLNLR